MPKKKESKFDYTLLTVEGKEDELADEVELYVWYSEFTFNLKEIIELRDLLNTIIDEMS